VVLTFCFWFCTLFVVFILVFGCGWVFYLSFVIYNLELFVTLCVLVLVTWVFGLLGVLFAWVLLSFDV